MMTSFPSSAWVRVEKNEGTRPGHAALVPIPESVDPVQILNGRVVLSVKGKIDDQFPVVARSQRLVGQDSHVREQHVAGTLAATPPESVRDEHLVLLRHVHRLEEHLLELVWRLPGLSYIRAASMIPSVSTPEGWIETVGFVGSSPTRISPTMPAQVRSSGRPPDAPAPEFGTGSSHG